MTDKHFHPTAIDVDNDEATVNIDWADEHRSGISVDRLRAYCPCAECQGHGGGIAAVAHAATSITAVDMVGRYAVQLTFDDSHSTGIYRFDYLRRLDPTEEERWGKPDTVTR